MSSFRPCVLVPTYDNPETIAKHDQMKAAITGETRVGVSSTTLSVLRILGRRKSRLAKSRPRPFWTMTTTAAYRTVCHRAAVTSGSSAMARYWSVPTKWAIGPPRLSVMLR